MLLILRDLCPLSSDVRTVGRARYGGVLTKDHVLKSSVASVLRRGWVVEREILGAARLQFGNGHRWGQESCAFFVDGSRWRAAG